MRLAQQRAVVTVQNPIALDDRSVPPPDLALLRLRADRYVTAHPNPSEVLLVRLAKIWATIRSESKCPDTHWTLPPTHEPAQFPRTRPANLTTIRSPLLPGRRR